MLKTMTVRATIAAILAGLSMSAHAIADSPKTVDIPAGDLRQALLKVSEQFGADLVFSPEQVQGFKTGGAHGQLTTEQAVTKLLEGTPLELRTDPSGAMLIAPPTAAKDAPQASMHSERPKSFWSRLAQASSPSQGEDRGEVTGREDREQATGDQRVEDPPQSPKRTELEEIVVTGTNIYGSEPAGSKVIVIDRETLDRSGHGRMQDVLATLSQNFNGINENNSLAPSNRSRGAEVQLRGLGVGTTLTLVNGQRQALGGQRASITNISSIPISAIDRIEVLPEGASAIYGSDAIGGVVNIVLRKDYSGLETRLRASSADGGAEETQFAQLFGATWSRASLLIGYDYYERERLAAGARPYSASNDDLRRFGGTDFRRFGGNPGTLIDPATQLPTHAIPVGQDGTNLTNSQLIPGAGNYYDAVTFGTVLPWTRTHSAFISSSLYLNESWEVFVQGRYGSRDMEVIAANSNSTLPVPTTNAFNRLGRAVRVAYDLTDDLGPQVQTGATETYFANVGIAGDLSVDWQFKLSAAYGQERDEFRTQNVLSSNFLPYLASSDPAVALNVFGDGSHTNPATLDAIRSYSLEFGTSKTSSLNAIASGPLFEGPGGAIKVAIGADYRTEQFAQESFQLQQTRTRDVERAVSAFFGEVAIPLLGPNDDVRRNRLEVSLAGRYEEYDDFGSSFDPKLGLGWRPWSFIALRGTWGTSFRAPPFYLSSPQFSAPTGRASFVTDPLSSAPNRQSQVLQIGGNNPDVNEETAEVWTAGFDLTFPVAENLSFSVTYFDINYEDKIITPGPSSSILVEEAKWRDVITRNPTQAEIAAICGGPGFTGACTGPFAAIIDLRTRNLSGLKVRGFDSEINYALLTGLGKWGISLRGTYTYDYQTRLTDSDPLFEAIDTLENPLALRLSASASWSLRGWTVVATSNYAGAYRNTGAIPASRIDSWTTMDLGVGYLVDRGHGWLDNTRISLNAVNLFDKEPPFVNRAGVYGYDQANGSLLGRQVSAQVVKSW